MSVLREIQNIKIPYPVEGVIRTAQLDDTITPQDSVQLAVNMNFDRVGALQTRPGVTEYADDLPEAIKNYGTLRNAIVPPGYSTLYQLGEIAEIVSDTFQSPTTVKISDTKIAVFWTGEGAVGLARMFEIDQETGDITPIGSQIQFDAGPVNHLASILVNSTHALITWNGVSNDGFAQAFDVTGSTLVAEGSPLEFDTSFGQFFSLALIDSSHVICFYTGPSDQGIATVFAVDGSGNVTEPGSPLTFEAAVNFSNSCVSLGDGTHFVNFWSGANAYAQCFTVNTGTWAITANGSLLTYGSSPSRNNALYGGSATRVVNVYNATVVAAQAFAVDAGTFAVTTVGTPVTIDSGGSNDVDAVGFGDGEHFVVFFSENVGEGYVQMIERDPSTSNMSLVGSRKGGYDFANGGYTSSIQLSSNQVMAVWGNVDAEIGQAVMFQSYGDVVEGRWLYAAHGDKVSNTDDGTWVSRRSGLAQVSKPRFAQYLNYLWMVNGNEQIGGDPVATSNGGNFGTDLVPDNFPPGDFIHAGFEGRVWVANKTLGTIYYTDIVQFIPPVTYLLTYNPQVNILSQLQPQTGQSFTALQRVPRALLVFTEDTITRIYGASSVDAYPAYNVGTYSQESIIETKTGIFFHHSSGFYQFDYGSQPVEISRRIIDFVKAIDREFYQDITGVYDGFDNVEWSVGQVVVEGVVFSNCVLRYTISTQVWTIYDYVGNEITAMIFYDDGETINHLMGTEEGKTGAMDTGYTDFGEPFYYEFIDRWRSFTEMYYQVKNISGLSVYSENAAGANVLYQIQKSGPNAWEPIGTIDQNSNSLLPNSETADFNVIRLRVAGNTQGVPVVIHGIEITELAIKGQDQN
jgi:hypothetical protein